MTTKAPVFLKYKGVTIYHTYHERYDDILNDYWYSTSPTRRTRYQFDIRDLEVVGSNKEAGEKEAGEMAYRRAIICRAIDNNTLPVSIPRVISRTKERVL